MGREWSETGYVCFVLFRGIDALEINWKPIKATAKTVKAVILG